MWATFLRSQVPAKLWNLDHTMGNYIVETQKPQKNKFLDGCLFQLPSFIDYQRYQRNAQPFNQYSISVELCL